MTMAANGLAKLLEELVELTQVTAKKLAYIDTDDHPDGAGSLKLRMELEMGDVMAAMILFVQEQFGLSGEVIESRTSEKYTRFWLWHTCPDGDPRSPA